MRTSTKWLLALVLLLAPAAFAQESKDDQPQETDAQKVAAEAPQASAPEASASPVGVQEVEVRPPLHPGSTVFITNRPEKRYVGQPISLSLKDADLVEVLRTFAKLGDFNLVIQPGVQGKVTAELHDVPWDQALEAVLKINNLGMEINGNVVRVAPPEP